MTVKIIYNDNTPDDVHENIQSFNIRQQVLVLTPAASDQGIDISGSNVDQVVGF